MGSRRAQDGGNCLSAMVVVRVALVALCSVLGFLMSGRYSSRVRALSALQAAVDRLGTQVLLGIPLPQALEAAGDASDESKVFLITARLMLSDFTLSSEQAMQQALGNETALQKGDILLLCQYLELCASSPSLRQEEILLQTKQGLNRQIELARRSVGQEGKMAKTLGVIAGVFLVLITL